MPSLIQRVFYLIAALAFSLKAPTVDGTIVGASSPEEVVDGVKASAAPLSCRGFRATDFGSATIGLMNRSCNWGLHYTQYGGKG